MHEKLFGNWSRNIPWKLHILCIKVQISKRFFFALLSPANFYLTYVSMCVHSFIHPFCLFIILKCVFFILLLILSPINVINEIYTQISSNSEHVDYCRHVTDRWHACQDVTLTRKREFFLCPSSFGCSFFFSLPSVLSAKISTYMNWCSWPIIVPFRRYQT